MKTSNAKQQAMAILKSNVAATVGETRETLSNSINNLLDVVRDMEDGIQDMSPVEVEICLAQIQSNLRDILSGFDSDVADLVGRDGLLKVIVTLGGESPEDRQRRKDFKADRTADRKEAAFARKERAAEKREEVKKRKEAKAAAKAKSESKSKSTRKTGAKRTRTGSSARK